jgi:hypothetical protein
MLQEIYYLHMPLEGDPIDLNVNGRRRIVCLGDPQPQTNLRGVTYNYTDIIFDVTGEPTESAGRYELDPESETNHVVIRGPKIPETITICDTSLAGLGVALMVDPDGKVLQKDLRPGHVIRYGTDFFISFHSLRERLTILEYCQPAFAEGMEVSATRIGQKNVGGKRIPQEYWDRYMDLTLVGF